MSSAIYKGIVRHKRYSPHAHEFSYNLFMPLIDLQEMNEFFSHSIFWSNAYPALAWFRRKDYFDKTTQSLDTVIRNYIEKETGRPFLGSIKMLTHLRYFGYIINPLTCYYCYDEAGKNIKFIIAEITNTPWKERHHYLIPCQGAEVSQHRFSKAFHVSPFMPMDLSYHWQSNTPSDSLQLKIENYRNEELIFDASLNLQRVPVTTTNLNKALFTQPFLTLQIATAIYRQAYKLWRKGVRFIPHPHNPSVSEQQ